MNMRIVNFDFFEDVTIPSIRPIWDIETEASLILVLTGNQRIWVCTQTADMQRSFEDLSASETVTH